MRSLLPKAVGGTIASLLLLDQSATLVSSVLVVDALCVKKRVTTPDLASVMTFGKESGRSTDRRSP